MLRRALILLGWATAVSLAAAGSVTGQEDRPGRQWAQELAALQDRAGATRQPASPRRVLAFYYGWYGTPEGSGEWRHWRGVDMDAHSIASSTHWPRRGPYDSHDPAVLDEHCRLAAEAGLDGFIVSWWHPDDFHDRGIPPLLEAVARHGLAVTAYLETVPSGTPGEAVERMAWILEHHAGHPAWLRVDGRPVLFVYGRAVQELGAGGWALALELLAERVPGGAVVIGDGLDPGTARVFDGVHTYNVTGTSAGAAPAEIGARARGLWRALERVPPGRIRCATVIPGYDDTKLGRPGLRPTTARHDGATLRVLWEAALASPADWILVTSFNEWHEGSEVEPSLEHGDRELRTLAELTAAFHAPPRPVAVLPGAASPALWFLLDRGVPLVAVEWEDVVAPGGLDPESLPVLLYAGGEHARATVRGPLDVPRALRRYVEAGGTLLVLPSEPLPLYYDAGGRPVDALRALGLPLDIAWERPPEGVRPRFRVVGGPGGASLPEALPFPGTGDRRWRPMTAPDGDAGRLEPWIVLEDAATDPPTRLGVAAGRLRLGRGSVLYAWFRLLDGPRSRVLLRALFDVTS